MREQRKKIAQETVEILKQGFYMSSSGVRVDISDIQKYSEKNSCLISPAQGEEITETVEHSLTAIKAKIGFVCKVIDESTVTTILNIGEPVAVLNFASAKNPGGGFLNGAMAQEEALAISSGLYNTQIRHTKYYEENRRCNTAIYTDNAIYSPDVPFFRDSEYNLIEIPIKASVLTLPAVNMTQVRERREDINNAKTVMRNRMRLALAILAHYKHKNIVLGAYGCGVFGNHPNTVAGWWKKLLYDEKYGCLFNKVIFAVLDKQNGDNITAFKRVFGEKR